jgi:hypothetical protein
MYSNVNTRSSEFNMVSDDGAPSTMLEAQTGSAYQQLSRNKPINYKSNGLATTYQGRHEHPADGRYPIGSNLGNVSIIHLHCKMTRQRRAPSSTRLTKQISSSSQPHVTDGWSILTPAQETLSLQVFRGFCAQGTLLLACRSVHVFHLLIH